MTETRHGTFGTKALAAALALALGLLVAVSSLLSPPRAVQADTPPTETARPSTSGQLGVSGTQLVDAEGRPSSFVA